MTVVTEHFGLVVRAPGRRWMLDAGPLDLNRTDWKPVPPLAKRLLTEPAYQTKRCLVIRNTSRLWRSS